MIRSGCFFFGGLPKSFMFKMKSKQERKCLDKKLRCTNVLSTVYSFFFLAFFSVLSFLYVSAFSFRYSINFLLQFFFFCPFPFLNLLQFFCRFPSFFFFSFLISFFSLFLLSFSAHFWCFYFFVHLLFFIYQDIKVNFY